MKKVFYLILIAIILGLSYLKWQANNEQFVASPSPTPSPSASPIKSSTNKLETLYFELDYPLDASSSTLSEGPDSQSWRISFMGDTQKNSGRTQTELFDGYIITVTRFEAIGEQVDLDQANADRQGIIDACGEDNVTKIESSKLGTYDTVSYYGGCLGESTQHYLISGGSLYRISEMVVGPQSSIQKYEEQSKAILDSLIFKKNN